MQNSQTQFRTWLPIYDGNVAERLKELQTLVDEGKSIYEDLRFLSNHDLNQRELEKLGAFVERNAEKLAPTGFETFKLGVVSNASMKLLKNALIGISAGYGVILSLTFSDFDQAFQLAHTPTDPFFNERFDGILHATFTEGLSLPHEGFDNQAESDSRLQSLIERVNAEITGLTKISNAPIFVQNFSQPPARLFGNSDGLIEGTQASSIQTFNNSITEICRNSSAKLIDIDHLSAELGLKNWADQRTWNLAKMPLSNLAIVPYCNLLARTFAAVKGKSRRALILDLDNTLWGGVIGDDGLDGIVLGQGSPDGEAFQEVQKIALALSKRGIVLSVCSKNTESIALEPFNSHPEMILKPDDIAVFVANWQDKASNIRQIAETLSLGLDSFVFLDDNPAERTQVRGELPLVMVPEVSKDPSDLARVLVAGGFFELSELSQADRERSAQYAANAKRLQLKSSVSDMSSYYESLEMEAEFRPFESANLKRITQLINKSNQFNLTTRRYTQEEVAEIADGKNSKVGFSVRLKDKFGDNGIISVIILDTDTENPGSESKPLLIDSWLMSCRVLGRQVEEFIINKLSQYASENGFSELVGEYYETPRNGMVRELYPRLSFKPGGSENVHVINTNAPTFLDCKIEEV